MPQADTGAATALDGGDETADELRYADVELSAEPGDSSDAHPAPAITTTATIVSISTPRTRRPR
ncbi:hypothetical protein G3I13_09500 [Streptomyces sp. SID6673]|nr:hypothetical protein [Streptomyces sp. SID11726]NEB24563.1 hypothetical protein [Streptomyces sp. SID6673]